MDCSAAWRFCHKRGVGKHQFLEIRALWLHEAVLGGLAQVLRVVREATVADNDDTFPQCQGAFEVQRSDRLEAVDDGGVRQVHGRARSLKQNGDKMRCCLSVLNDVKKQRPFSELNFRRISRGVYLVVPAG